MINLSVDKWFEKRFWAEDKNIRRQRVAIKNVMPVDLVFQLMFLFEIREVNAPAVKKTPLLTTRTGLTYFYERIKNINLQD